MSQCRKERKTENKEGKERRGKGGKEKGRKEERRGKEWRGERLRKGGGWDRRKEVIKVYLAARGLNQMEITSKF